MKSFVVSLLFFMLTAGLTAQSIDEKRMERDVEVAENILSNLLKEALPRGGLPQAVEGTYLEGYGILFTVRNRFSVFGTGQAPVAAWGRGRGLRPGGRVRIEVPEGDASGVVSEEMPDRPDLQEIRSLAETFLADYGYLLTQLPKKERICIKYGSVRSMAFVGADDLAVISNDSPSHTPGFTMIVDRATIDDHRSGRLSREALIEKIVYTENEPEARETDRELVLLNSIFHRLYQRDLSDGFFMRGTGKMEKIPGLGALLSYDFATKGQMEGLFFEDGVYRFYFDDDARGEEDRIFGLRFRDYKESEEKEVEVESADEEGDEEEMEPAPDFDLFLDDFKANIIEYGSTVRKLEADEVLSFSLQFPKCRNCDDDRPEKVKITAPIALLQRYRQGAIDLDEAVEQLQVTYDE